MVSCTVISNNNNHIPNFHSTDVLFSLIAPIIRNLSKIKAVSPVQYSMPV